MKRPKGLEPLNDRSLLFIASVEKLILANLQAIACY